MGRQEALKAKADMWEQVKAWAEKQGVKRMTRGIFKRVLQSSMYVPHQGARECARRLRDKKVAGTRWRTSPIIPAYIAIRHRDSEEDVITGFLEEAGEVTEKAWEALGKR